MMLDRAVIVPDRPSLIVVTGIQAAGKSTIGRRLAQRFARGVHVEADVLQGMVVSGGEGVSAPGVASEEAIRQLRLRLCHMCLLGRAFLEEGFTAILDDIITGERWDHLQADLAGVSFNLVILAPRVDVVVQERDAKRGKRPLGEAWATYLDADFRATMSDKDIWVDNSDQTPDETVDEILRRLGIATHTIGQSAERG